MDPVVFFEKRGASSHEKMAIRAALEPALAAWAQFVNEIAAWRIARERLLMAGLGKDKKPSERKAEKEAAEAIFNDWAAQMDETAKKVQAAMEAAAAEVYTRAGFQVMATGIEFEPGYRSTASVRLRGVAQSLNPESASVRMEGLLSFQEGDDGETKIEAGALQHGDLLPPSPSMWDRRNWWHRAG